MFATRSKIQKMVLRYTKGDKGRGRRGRLTLQLCKGHLSEPCLVPQEMPHFYCVCSSLHFRRQCREQKALRGTSRYNDVFLRWIPMRIVQTNLRSKISPKSSVLSLRIKTDKFDAVEACLYTNDANK